MFPFFLSLYYSLPIPFCLLLPFFTAEEKLEDFLEFWTGKKNIPLLGFDPKLTIAFRHMDGIPNNDPSRGYPKVNACAHQLILPVGHKTTCKFLHAMNYALETCKNIFDDR